MDLHHPPDGDSRIGGWRRLRAFLVQAMNRLMSRNRCARCENTRFFF